MSNDLQDGLKDTVLEATPTATPLADPPVSPGARIGVGAAALVAGVALLLLSALAGFGNFVVVQGLVTPGDAAGTAADISASAGLFRLGVAALYLAAVLDVVVAWALMRVFSGVHEDLSRFAAWLRLAYAGVFLVALAQLAGIPGLLDTSGYAAVTTAEQSQGQALLKVDSFEDIWFAGLVLFGLHLAVVGYLAYRSGFVPRVVGVLRASSRASSRK